jgi:phenylpropionate dioxygenase-like ring-hydroxylating dioxygenase large terminal subunit
MTKDYRECLEYHELGTGPIPLEPNISREYFEREREKIFRRTWLCVGRVEEVPEVGDFFVRALEILKTKLIVMRGKDGQIRCFYDVCRHRGNGLSPSCKGNTGGLVCGFHGWTYDLTGKLLYVPDEAQFHELDKSEYGLKHVAMDIWEGFIFINADPHPSETLEESLGEVFPIFEGFAFGPMVPVGCYSAIVNANWKIFMDITQEAYHVPFLHGRIVPDSNTGKGNPYCHIPSIRFHGRHRSSTMYANPEHTPTAAEAIAYKYGPTVIEPTTNRETLPECLNPDGIPSWGFDSYVIFPNLIIHIGNGWYITHKFWPVTVDRTSWEFVLHMMPAGNPGEKIGQEFSKILSRDLSREDLGILERVQGGLSSGVLTHMPLSDQEVMLRHSYKTVEEYLALKADNELQIL